MATCEFRSVDKDGRVICRKLPEGDNDVSIALCHDCPMRKSNCEHLRFTLFKTTPSPIVVRYATGRVEVWNNEPAALHFRQAACALKVSPVHSADQCAACSVRSCRVASAPERVMSGRVVAFPQPVAAAG